MANINIINIFNNITRKGLGAPLIVVMMLSMVVLPLPPFILDILFTFNIAFSLMVLLSGIYAKKPLDFGIFPTLLLVTTLLRLALNIASTRVVLLDGHNGTDVAGNVIKAFGEVVIGGNYAVGFVIFIILIIINFVVVTKGAGRVSEVTARFTLDAMPGKQMGIDADLNSGLCTQEEATQRRAEISQEADFYGAMDGASKFVRGDAIAGILILIVNLIGGLCIGTLQHDMAFNDALRIFALLTIGDGLVAQIPSLILSTATAIMVTRVSSEEDMSEQVSTQLVRDPKALIVTGSIIGSLGLIPGMPHFIFFLIAFIIGCSAYYIYYKSKKSIELEALEKESIQSAPPDTNELGWEDIPPLDVIGLEIGYRLIPMVDKNQGAQLMSKIRGVRKKISQELGFLIPTVHIRDNLDLQPNDYRLSINGVNVGESTVCLDKDMALNPGQVFGELEGTACIDPAFGLEALWIEPQKREQAQSLGYTVVDTSTVIATHISKIIKDYGKELLNHDDIQKMLDVLAKSMPKLVEDAKLVPIGCILKVMQNLLKEGIPIRDIRTIISTITDNAPKNLDPEELTSLVRIALRELIIQNIVGAQNEITVITLEAKLEQILQKSIQAGTNENATIEPGLTQRLQKALVEQSNKQEILGNTPILLVSSMIRTLLSHFMRQCAPRLHILSYQEVPDNRQIKIVSTIGE